MTLKLPCVLGGRYECTKRIGSGGMGEVYLARHMGLDRDVAVKLLTLTSGNPSQQERIRERFRREAVALSRLRHPNTVQVIDFGWTNDQRPYIVTELLTGRTLDLELVDNGPFQPDRALHIMIQICRSLAEAHGFGIVHRDLKPSNVFLIEAFGTQDYVKLIDFGVARIDDTDESAKARPLTVEGTTLGTPDYMAPEQARGHKPSPATDVYALGCMLYEMLIGNPPFTGDSALQVMIKHIKQEPKLISEVRPDTVWPPGLEHALMICTRKAMEERPRNAGVLVDLLRELQKSAAQLGMEAVASLDGLSDVFGFDEIPIHEGASKSRPGSGSRFFADAASDINPAVGDQSGLHRVRTTQRTDPGSKGGYRRPLSLKRGARGKNDRGLRNTPGDEMFPPEISRSNISLDLEQVESSVPGETARDPAPVQAPPRPPSPESGQRVTNPTEEIVDAALVEAHVQVDRLPDPIYPDQEQFDGSTQPRMQKATTPPRTSTVLGNALSMERRKEAEDAARPKGPAGLFATTVPFFEPPSSPKNDPPPDMKDTVLDTAPVKRKAKPKPDDRTKPVPAMADDDMETRQDVNSQLIERHIIAMEETKATTETDPPASKPEAQAFVQTIEESIIEDGRSAKRWLVPFLAATVVVAVGVWALLHFIF